MKLHSFTVLPTTPPKLEPLLKMAYNLWFSWNWDARQLYAKLDRETWGACRKNPLKMLCDISPERLAEAAEDEGFVSDVEAVYATFNNYINAKGWYEEQYGKEEKPYVAYFSCEYGFHESLPIYSGGLGILAGDHLKSASDLGVPLIAVGLLYRQGYFRQILNADGEQHEYYPENDWFSMPATLEKDQNGNPIILTMDMGGDEISFQIWQVKVGRISLYLLDTNLLANPPHHRDITKRLYDADRDTRVRQEILLGIGGVKALKALGITPSIYHINEGHSAFLILERLRQLMKDDGLSFAEAKEIVWATNIFTTHTPVPAGNEHFDRNLLRKYLSNMAKELGLGWNDFLATGMEDPNNKNEEFCLTILALNFSSSANGVSELHGKVSRNLWKKLYPNLPTDEIPIGHITNGVHTKTWLNKHLESVFIRYLQTAYVREIADFTLWKMVDDIPDKELWKAHQARKENLVEHVRSHLAWQHKRRGSSAGDLDRISEIMDPNTLTIGFARRFAPYKRGNLLFRDIERLEKIVTDAKRPVVFIFAGKAHPADIPGKEIIKELISVSQKEKFFNNIIFLEDYDIDVARYLVSGVDVWLNTPRRPLEASGTSGMKAAINGALNLSILDGWWDEAFNTKNGWALGYGEMYDDHAKQDEIEGKLLYHLLEQEVIPTYYDKKDHVPYKWVKMMENTIKTCGTEFNAHRMVIDYIEKHYLKGKEHCKNLRANNFEDAKHLAAWRSHIVANFNNIEVVEVEPPVKEVVFSGNEVCIKAKIKLGQIEAKDLVVEVYHGTLQSDDTIKDPHRVPMSVEKSEGDITIFSAMIPCNHGGRYGYTVRILPEHRNLASEFIPNLIKWEHTNGNFQRDAFIKTEPIAIVKTMNEKKAKKEAEDQEEKAKDN